MKSISILLAILIAAVFSSCKTQPTEPGTATIKGHVVLATYIAYYTPPYTGIRVSLDGTTYVANTDDSGYFELDNVPSGTYNVSFSKPGYGTVRWIGKEIQGGGNAPIYWNGPDQYPVLFKQPDLVAHLNNVFFQDTAFYGGVPPLLVAQGQYSGSWPIGAGGIVVYISHTANVSSQSGNYTNFFFANELNNNGWIVFDTSSHSFRIPITQNDLQTNGFHSGDSVYVAAYGAPWYNRYPLNDYFDPVTHEYVLTALNQTPSPVIGVKIP